MKNRTLYICTFLLLVFLNPLSSKADDFTQTRSSNLFVGSAFIHTKGYGLDFRYGTYANVERIRIIDLDLLYIKHPKEVRVVNQIFDQARPFVYGKMNALLSARISAGNQHVLADRRERNSVRLNLNYSFGFNAGLVKPVHVEIYHLGEDRSRDRITTERYDPNKHTRSDIYGGSSFFNGFDELGFVPGLVGKTSISVEWGNQQSDIRAVEAGIMVDAFLQEIPIFAFIENQSVYVNLFIKYSIGKRW
jgi:hypothetical protein